MRATLLANDPEDRKSRESGKSGDASDEAAGDADHGVEYEVEIEDSMVNVRVHGDTVFIDHPNMFIHRTPTITQLVGYLKSWSAYATWKNQNAEKLKNGEVEDIIDVVERRLREIYGGEDVEIPVHYPLFVLLAVAK